MMASHITGTELLLHRTSCIFSILSLSHVIASIQRENSSATSCLIRPLLSWPQPQSFSLISIIHEGLLALHTQLPAPIKEHRGVRLFGAISSCSELQWLNWIFIYHMCKVRSAMSHKFLKLGTSCSHK